MLILYHTGMGFVPWGWHVKNNEISEWLTYPMLFLNRWRLPLLFFISGAGVAFSLRRRTTKEFRNERVRRLLIPVLFAMFVVVPPQIYFERLFQGATYESYWAFYPEVFRMVPYPKGATSWHHLWFVVYILFHSLISLPLYGRLGFIGYWILGARWRVYAAALPNLLAGITLGPHFPTTHALFGDWANLIGTWLTFVWGYVFASDGRLLDMLTARRKEFAVAGAIAATLFFATRNEVASNYFGMAAIFALTGYARVWVTQSTPLLRYATEAVFPLYIAHQTITVALVFWLRNEPYWWAAKFAVVAAGTLAASLLVFEAVRRAGPLRPLFGLR